MELRHLRYFVAVAEALHMGRAAQQLHIAQPSLSQQIAALEAEIGTLLFIRKGRGLYLSAAGSAFLEYARSTLALAHQAIQVAREVGRGETGHLSVGYVSSLTYTYLPDVVQQFRTAYPGVTLDLREMSVASQVRALQDHTLQIGLLRGPLDNGGLDCSTLVSEPFVLALPVSHPLAAQDLIPMASLRHDALIVHRGGVFFDQVRRLCAAGGFELRVAQEVSQIHAAVGLVSAGLGVALVPVSASALTIAGVVFRPIDQQDIVTHVLMATLADTRPLTAHHFLSVARRAMLAAYARYRPALYGATPTP